MRYNELVESYTDIEDENIEKIISEYRRILIPYLKKDIQLYRGMKASSPIIIADGSTLNRKAANTSNYVNKLTEVLPSWQNWPKRTKSFICSTNKNTAQNYATRANYHNIAESSDGLFNIIPLEHQKIGVVNDNDFWEFVPKYISNLTQTAFDVYDINNDIIYKLLNRGSLYFNIILGDNIENKPLAVINYLNIICNKLIEDSYIDRLTNKFEQTSLVPVIKEINKIGAESFLNNCLDPSEKCELLNNILDLDNNRYIDNEV
jgi:hypothetical protein